MSAIVTTTTYERRIFGVLVWRRKRVVVADPTDALIAGIERALKKV